ncbi:MAG: DNA gyrase subunit A [Lachnospiraceae bacterium]|nr:DNA gyrase subunit A [Lachnospiraceae bacterium]
MDEHIFDQINEVDLKKTMEKSYIEYAMSVIAARALPDARDGLKPVQRRILYAMIELGNSPDKPHRKCARIVGDTMGKYHPHGDSSIYGALVNLAQEWSTRYPLVDGHGNFGSVDGDGAAAMRYTEARLSKISMEMLADINKDTVDFVPNFDETEKEPVVLPSRIPNLLVNGTSGIAVGMATNIPPHNLGEVVKAVVKIIDNKLIDAETTIDEVMSIVKGPDFPTGAQILGTRGIEEAYRTGRGKIRIRAVTDIEAMANGKNRIVVTELPYAVNKAKLLEKIAEMVREKRIDGITDLRDESNREGMRMVIELRRDANPQVVLNHLYKHTQLQDTFGVIMLALVGGEPKVLTLLDMLNVYLTHQEEVVRRRTQYDLAKAEERAHILEALLKALDFIDEVIKIIRGSKTTPLAKQGLMERFGFDDVQAQAIVDMRLRQLTGLEKEKIQDEFAELQRMIAEFKEILANEKKLLEVVKKELIAISDKYTDDRRTEIVFDESEMSMEDFVPDDKTVITMTRRGYIKRMSPDNFRTQNRGGKGIKGMQTIEDDVIERMLTTTNHKLLLFFTDKGRVYKLKAFNIPEASRTSRGIAIVNLLMLQPEEKISAIIPIDKLDMDGNLIMATAGGTIKKTPVREYANIRKIGIQAITLRDDDRLIEVNVSSGKDIITMATANGLSITFDEEDVRETGRSAMGVKGIRLTEGDRVIGMQIANAGPYFLFITENGMGKRSRVEDFRSQNRGGKGLICYKLNEKTGKLVAMKAVNEENDVIMITNEGIIVRTEVGGISVIGRNTSGVKCMNLGDENVKVAGIAITDKEEEIPEEVSVEEAAQNAEGNESETEDK